MQYMGQSMELNMGQSIQERQICERQPYLVHSWIPYPVYHINHNQFKASSKPSIYRQIAKTDSALGKYVP